MIGQTLRRLGWRELLWLAAGLVLIVLMRENLLSYEDKLAPLSVAGALKQRVVAREFAVTVDGFRLARRYKTGGDYASDNSTRELKTSGIWLALPVKIEMLQRPGYLSARLRTRDGIYYRANSEQRPRVRGVNLAGQQFVPGLGYDGAFFFELPPEQLPGAHVEFFVGTLTPPSNDGLIDVDLGTGKASSAELLARAFEEVDLRP